jgi:type II secretory pathway pseudopilin PulG
MRNLKRVAMLIIAFMIVMTMPNIAEAKASSKKIATGKKALKQINSYRKKAGVDKLEWSDELYGACIYRLKTSGYDKHENVIRDLKAYFGGLYYTIDGEEASGFGENLTRGQNNMKAAVRAWRKSEGHYRNMISKDYKCCAVAKYKNMYITLFSTASTAKIKALKSGADNNKTAIVNVKIKSGETGEYEASGNIVIYDTEDKWNLTNTARIKDSSGVDFKLTVGHTYVVYCPKIIAGDNKVRRVEFTVTADGNRIELVR